MNLELGKVYSGFKYMEEKEIPEINSTGKLFYHEKSGARLLYLQNDDDNKVFSIAFRTPPTDSTGVPHILEHSVLCGSRKFPCKEPFVELIKGSLNTFLNAMTYPDKTVYPVASRNDKDFTNLMDVYLDATLYPNIYKYPEIFMQEGWHYELENKEDELNYKGVVYNEMKGAFSSPESILFRKVQQSLFPDNTYGVESGGDPDNIPDLTYEQFIGFHKKYYHPSNSYIYLYGDMDILEKLNFINENYLKNFDKIEVDSSIPMQKAFSNMNEQMIEYPIADNEKEEDKTYLSLSFVGGNSLDSEFRLAFDILESILLETPSSPLKKALIDAGLGKDVFGFFEYEMLQPIFGIVVKNSNESEKERFKKVVFDTLTNLVKEGIDKKLIEAAINIKEFNLREAEFNGAPKGLFYNLKCLASWLYDGKPYTHLEYEEPLKKVKSALTTNYFENLIEKYILNNNHSSLVAVKPKKGLAEQKAKELKDKLAKYKAGLNEKEVEEVVNNTKKLLNRQNSQDSQEDLNSIPLLKISDIESKAEKLPIEEKMESGVKVLHHPIFTNGIGYINLYFDSSVVNKELIPYLGLLSAVMGEVSTKNYSYGDLANEVNIHTGGIRYNAETFSDDKKEDVHYPKFVVRAKAIVDKLPDMFHLLDEILVNTNFEDKKRLKEIIQETKSRLEMSMLSRGHVVAANRLSSYFSQVSKYNDIISGLGFYKFVSEIEKNFEEKSEEIICNLTKVYKDVFNKNNMFASVVIDEKDYNSFVSNFNNLTSKLRDNKIPQNTYKFELKAENEGLMASAKVQYVSKGYSFKKLGYDYTGKLLVLKTITSYDYLWNKVRVMGGAYGCFASFDRVGKMTTGSYRDPNLVETIKVYEDMYKYIENFEADEREMTKYIIGTISGVDRPLTPVMKGEVATEQYIRNISFEDKQRERDEILSTNVQDIKNLSSLAKECMNKDYICVIGNEEKIKENKDKFNNLVNLFD